MLANNFYSTILTQKINQNLILSVVSSNSPHIYKVLYIDNYFNSLFQYNKLYKLSLCYPDLRWSCL